jgi:hypothetical protein
MTLMSTIMTGRMRWKRWMTRSPSTLHHAHHHDGSIMTTNGFTETFHALRVDQIGKVCEATLIVVLTNSTLEVMMILSLRLSLQFLSSMVCMMLKLI